MQTSRQTVQTASPVAERISHWFARHWLALFNTFWGIFVVVPWLAPIFMTLGLTGLGHDIYFAYSFVCHQLPERSWFLFGPHFSYSQPEIAVAWGQSLSALSNEMFRRQFIGTPELGWKVAWSDRMVSMYSSIFVFGLLYAALRRAGLRLKPWPWWLAGLLILPLALDGTTHMINDLLRLDFRQTNQWAAVLTNHIFSPQFYVGDKFGSLNSLLRLVTGVLFGLGLVGFLWPMMDAEYSPKPEEP